MTPASSRIEDVLQPGIRIQSLDPLLPLGGVIEINSGSEYLPNAVDETRPVVARSDWVAVPGVVSSKLVADGLSPLPDCVSILRLDDALRVQFRRQVAPVLFAGAGPDSSVRQSTLRAFAQDVTRSIDRAGFLRCREFRSADIQATPSGRRSTAFDHVRRAFIGLHVDNHQNLQLRDRRQAFQVLSINLGEEDRYFTFVNLPFPEVAEWVRRADPTSSHSMSSRAVVAAFFEFYPSYPLIRVKLAPNCGYLATTQYLVHDGVPNDKAVVDLALLVSGFFERP